MQLAFFMKFPPEEFQELRPYVKNQYYDNPEFNFHYLFANLETRNIIWGEDIYKDQVLVGDSLTFSTSQIQEHFLKESFVIKDHLDRIIFVGYKTDPKEKCKAVKYQELRCEGIRKGL